MVVMKNLSSAFNIRDLPKIAATPNISILREYPNSIMKPHMGNDFTHCRLFASLGKKRSFGSVSITYTLVLKGQYFYNLQFTPKRVVQVSV